MDLKEFISQTVSAIVDASVELQEKYVDQDILINPPSAQSGSDVYQPGSSNYTMRRVQNVAFDVAVSASNDRSAGGGASIKVMSLEVGGSGEISTSSESISRVNFSLPLTLKPTADEGKNVAVADKERADVARGVANFSAPGVV